MTKEDIELLKGFLQAILPILIFTFVVILFFLYRKKIENFSSKITKIKGKIAGQEFETEIKESNIAISNERVSETSEQKVKIDIEEVEENLFDVWQAYSSNELEKAKQIFDQVQQKETDPQKKVHNENFHFYTKAVNGNINSIKEFEEFAKTIKYDEEKIEAYEYLGLIHKHSRTYERAIEEFNKANDLALVETLKSKITSAISECYYELGDAKKSESIIWDLYNTLNDQQAKCSCLRSLAELYNKQKLPFLRALVLEKAIEFEPNNIDILFALAYSYSICDLKALGMLHYKTLLFFDAQAGYARNNLGVGYQNFRMPLKANKEYYKAFEKGNTLAGGNLASNLIENGFYDEAKKIIEEAKKIDNYNNKIDQVSNELNKQFEAENEKEAEIIESATKQERFFKKFYDKKFNKTELAFSFEGDWLIGETFPLTNDNSQKAINLTWQTEPDKIELTGVFENLTCENVLYIDKHPDYSMLRRKSPGYAFMKDNLNEIEVLILIENSHKIIELQLKRII